jgi:hypothetical protein
MSKQTATFEWTIYVPTKSSKGRTFTKAAHARWEKQVMKITGGMTFHGKVKGLHLDPANREESIDVSIVCTTAQIRQIAIFTKKHYHQQAVLVIRGDPAFIL